MYRGMQSLCHAYVLHDFILSIYYVELQANVAEIKGLLNSYIARI